MKKIDKNIHKKQNKRKVKARKKISIINILFLVLILSLISRLVFKNRENFKNIFTKKNKIKASQASTAADLNIGDIVYYDHKRAVKKEDEVKQKVTIPVGNSKTPGSGSYQSGNQTFNAKDYNTTWRVWDKLSDGRVMLLSNRTVPYEDSAKNLKRFNTYGAVGHIWWEHNTHKISSIFGYGEGADTNATKEFAYKVGSGIDDAPDMTALNDPTDETKGYKSDWKIGGKYPEYEKDKINISGARSLTLPEVEDKLEITSDKIKSGFGDIEIGNNWHIPYGTKKENTTIPYVAQRDVDSPDQDWTGGDRLKGKAKNKIPGYAMTARYYN